MAEAQVLGVVGRSAAGPRVAYLNAALPVTEGILGAAGPVPPTRVLRIAARCEEARCTHFDGAACSLASRIVETLDAVTEALPPCVIRRSCRWFAEQGMAACLRCPQVVTQADESAVPAGLGKRLAAVTGPA